jgi:hypothetical protein
MSVAAHGCAPRDSPTTAAAHASHVQAIDPRMQPQRLNRLLLCIRLLLCLHLACLRGEPQNQCASRSDVARLPACLRGFSRPHAPSTTAAGPGRPCTAPTALSSADAFSRISSYSPCAHTGW